MNRRGFLGTLLASTAALTIDPQALLWKPSPDAVALAEPEALLTLTQITRAILREMRGSLPIYPFPMTADSGFTAQKSLIMQAPGEVGANGLSVMDYIRPAADVLSRGVEELLPSVRFCGWPPHPTIGTVEKSVIVQDLKTGLILRGIQQYADEWGADILRFDMVFG